MKRKKLIVQCVDYYHYLELMATLEELGFKWNSGDDPTKWDLYKERPYNTQLSIVLCLDLIEKKIGQYFLSEIAQDEYLFSVEEIKKSLKNYLNKLNKKPFEDLSCSDFNQCDNCPLNKYGDVCHTMIIQGTFKDILKRVGEEYTKAKEEYEKGDK